jgi:hypothetical protein
VTTQTQLQTAARNSRRLYRSQPWHFRSNRAAASDSGHLPPRRSAPIRTAEDTVALVRRLAAHYPDAVIAGILNRQERRTAYGHRFTANLVGGLRRHWNIPNFKRPSTAPEGELVNIRQAAVALDVAASTVHRLLNEGVIAGEQLTPGAPWRIRLTEDLRALVAEEAPEGYLTDKSTSHVDVKKACVSR